MSRQDDWGTTTLELSSLSRVPLWMDSLSQRCLNGHAGWPKAAWTGVCCVHGTARLRDYKIKQQRRGSSFSDSVFSDNFHSILVFCRNESPQFAEYIRLRSSLNIGDLDDKMARNLVDTVDSQTPAPRSPDRSSFDRYY